MISLWTFWRRVVLAVAACCALWGIVSFVYYWDPTRVIIKRIAATDPYRYDEIRPQFLKFDPEKAITIRTASEADSRRKKLASAIWGTPGLPPNYLLSPPDTVKLDAPRPTDCRKTAIGKRYGPSLPCKLELYRGIANLAEISRQKFFILPHLHSYIARFKPKKWNQWTVLYHHGYGGTYHDQHHNIARLIDQGYAVLAFNLPGLGKNRIPSPGLAAIGQIIGPVLRALDYEAAHTSPKGMAMIGFSAGGWTAVMAAALDTKLRATYTVASPIYPVPLSDPALEPPKITRVPKLLETLGYLDIFLLGTGGSRRQLQIFNRYDRCCWRNRTALLYADAVKGAASGLGGEFEVRIDETHARHKISRQAMDWILADLERIRS